ncbi:hypothetical protein SESBI_02184 [Sesbania bispinosa]|nr:hypothetical protein SESBI_02184 [Sesbania bispinosa]
MRSGVCKSSSSSSISRRQICSCGAEVALLMSRSAKNPDRMFWRNILLAIIFVGQMMKSLTLAGGLMNFSVMCRKLKT